MQVNPKWIYGSLQDSHRNMWGLVALAAYGVKLLSLLGASTWKDSSVKKSPKEVSWRVLLSLKNVKK